MRSNKEGIPVNELLKLYFSCVWCAVDSWRPYTMLDDLEELVSTANPEKHTIVVLFVVCRRAVDVD